MNVTFLLTIDSEVADPQALLQTADDIHDTLDTQFDVIDVKPWARPSTGLQPTEPQPNITGLPPVSGNL